MFVRSGDINLLSPSEITDHCRKVTAALDTLKCQWQLISIPRTLDIRGLIDCLQMLKRQTDSDAKLTLINGEINALREMTENGAKEPMIILKCWEKAAPKSSTELKKRLEIVRQMLINANVKAEILTNEAITYICKTFCELNVTQDKTDDDIVYSVQDKKKQKNDTTDYALLNIIAPVGGIDFKVSKTIVGAVVGRIYGAVRYPIGDVLKYGWATKIMNSPDCITCITFTPSNGNELADALSSSIKRSLGDAEVTKDARLRMQNIKSAEAAEELIGSIDQKDDSIGYMSIIAMPFTDDEDKLEDVCRRTVNDFKENRITLKALGNLQKEAFKSISLFYPSQTITDNMLNRITPLYTLAGGMPMTINSLRDDKGKYFAETKRQNIVAIDRWYRGGDRTNSNIVVLGKPGTGKSTCVKHIIQTDYMSGCLILIIDPETEYRDLTYKLGGVWIDAGGGKHKINPLQVRPAANDDEKEENKLYSDDDCSSDLALHLKTLEIFFKLYLPSLTDMQKALLKKALIDLYSKFNIFWDTDVSKLKNTDFPIFSDLYGLIISKAEQEPQYKDLAFLLEDISFGSDSFLWNGHTNISLDSDFICFDTNRLNNSSNDIKRTQYFNLLTLCWEIMSKDRSRAAALFCDEAYFIADPNVPECLMFARNISKRCRKYEGSLTIITHSVVDFLADEIKLYGQALLDVPTYKILFGTDGKNLKETAELFSLTQAEQDVLQSGVKAEAICFIGSQRMHLHFKIPDYKLELMGKGGGR